LDPFAEFRWKFFRLPDRAERAVWKHFPIHAEKRKKLKPPIPDDEQIHFPEGKGAEKIIDELFRFFHFMVEVKGSRLLGGRSSCRKRISRDSGSSGRWGRK